MAMSVRTQQMLQSARHSITPGIKHKEVSKMEIKQMFSVLTRQPERPNLAAQVPAEGGLWDLPSRSNYTWLVRSL